jgi:hypothetical protein
MGLKTIPWFWGKFLFSNRRHRERTEYLGVLEWDSILFKIFKYVLDGLQSHVLMERPDMPVS